MNKSIKKEDCSIEYDGIIYYPKEDFGLSTRKRINFLNVDLNKFKFPKDINCKEIKINTIDNKNFLISISIIDKPKVIAIYLNNPFIEKEVKYTESELIQILCSSLETIKKIVYINDNEIYDQYYKRHTEQIIDIYKQEIIKSYEIEKIICEYFLVPRKELNQIQSTIYNLYSDFMAYFPDLPRNSREKKIIDGFRYFQQYFYIAKALNNLNKTIPKKISESDKIKLKYSSCRCLMQMLNMEEENF